MNKRTKMIFAILWLMWILWTVVVPYVNASDVSNTPTTTSVEWISPISDKMIMPYPDNKSYEFDKNKVMSMVDNQKGRGIYEVQCNSKVVLEKILWVKVNSEITTLSMKRDWMLNTYDMENCEMNSYRANYNYSTKQISVDNAKSIWQKYINDVFKGKWIIYDIWTNPIVISKGYGWGIMYAKDLGTTSVDGVMVENDNVNEEIEIIEGQEEYIWKEYPSVTLLYPFTINVGGNKTFIYNSQWDKLGITLTIDGNGVSNAGVSMLKIKLVKKSGDLTNWKSVVNLLSKGWNSPYYGNDNKIIVNWYERWMVLSSKYESDWSVKKYLTTWIILNTENSKPYNNGEDNYRMVISDYSIWNNE